MWEIMFYLVLTDNYLINISCRELTLHVIQINIVTPLYFTNINIYIKSIFTNHNNNHNVVPELYTHHFF